MLANLSVNSLFLLFGLQNICDVYLPPPTPGWDTGPPTTHTPVTAHLGPRRCGPLTPYHSPARRTQSRALRWERFTRKPGLEWRSRQGMASGGVSAAVGQVFYERYEDQRLHLPPREGPQRAEGSSFFPFSLPLRCIHSLSHLTSTSALPVRSPLPAPIPQAAAGVGVGWGW